MFAGFDEIAADAMQVIYDGCCRSQLIEQEVPFPPEDNDIRDLIRP